MKKISRKAVLGVLSVDREIEAALAGKQTPHSIRCWGYVPQPKPREKHALIPGPDDPRDLDVFTASRRFNYYVNT